MPEHIVGSQGAAKAPASQAAMPTMAFVSGYLLPHGTYRLDMSNLAPGTCQLQVFESDDLPQAVVDLLDSMNGSRERPKGLWARAFSAGMGQINGRPTIAFVEVSVTTISWSRRRPADKTHEPPAAPPAQDAG